MSLINFIVGVLFVVFLCVCAIIIIPCIIIMYLIGVVPFTFTITDKTKTTIYTFRSIFLIEKTIQQKEENDYSNIDRYF